MKLFAVLGTSLALAVAAGPATAANSGTEDGGPPFVSGNNDGTLVFHCKWLGGHGNAIVQQKKDPDRVLGHCTF